MLSEQVRHRNLFFVTFEILLLKGSVFESFCIPQKAAKIAARRSRNQIELVLVLESALDAFAI
jgi:hypothetical protein